LVSKRFNGFFEFSLFLKVKSKKIGELEDYFHDVAIVCAKHPYIIADLTESVD